MEIRTARCTIRDFTPDDIDAFMAYRNNLDWMRYQGFKGMSRGAYEHALLGHASIAHGRQLAIALTATNQLIGDVYLRQEGEAYWLGYTIDPAYARQGYALEAVRAMIAWADGQGGSRIMAGVLPENTASIRLLERAGFTYEAQENDELIYALSLRKA